MKKVACFGADRTPYSLSNVCFMGNCTAEELRLAMLETQTADELIEVVNELTKLDWKLVRETDDVVQIVYKDTYIQAFKEVSSKVSAVKLRQAENYLIASGIKQRMAKECLKDICEILFDIDIYE